MILNIIDDRKRPHRWKTVNAIVEATWHDNSCPDADQAELPDDVHHVFFEDRDGLSVAEAIEWASRMPQLVTLYLSDA